MEDGDDGAVWVMFHVKHPRVRDKAMTLKKIIVVVVILFTTSCSRKLPFLNIMRIQLILKI